MIIYSGMNSDKRAKIEHEAWKLQAEIWRARVSLWTNSDIPAPHLMCTPQIAAKVLGVRYEFHGSLGSFGDGVNRYEVAGLIDRQNGKIAISQKPDWLVQRFTGGHELGHWILHASGLVMHRDRQVAGLRSERAPRSPQEREADYFAACFLVPTNILRAAFAERFGPIEQFRFSDDAAFGLCPSNPRSLMSCADDSLEWELALARSIRFEGIFFDSLVEMFSVSDITMAYRLREIGLRR